MKGVRRSKSGDASVRRSKTYDGIGKAMALQWGQYLKKEFLC